MATIADVTLTHAIDPRTGRRIGPGVEETTPAKLEKMLQEAAGAAPYLADRRPRERAVMLRGLADALHSQRDHLVELASTETGLGVERLSGELDRARRQMCYLAEVAQEGGIFEIAIDGAVASPLMPRPEMRRWMVPLGPVLVYAASNFPFAFGIFGGDSASALAAGAPVVVKADPAEPQLSQALAALADEACYRMGVPVGTVSVIFGEEQGISALRDPRIKACGFTGSTAAGRLLSEVAAGRPDPIPFFGELGSINPVIALPGAVAARGAAIIEAFYASFTQSAGQLCTKPGLLFLPRDHRLDEHLATISELPPAPLLSSKIAVSLADGLAAIHATDGVALVGSGRPVPDHGTWATPTLFQASAEDLRREPGVLQEELFGPVALIIQYDDVPDLLDTLDHLQGSLTGTVHAEPSDAGVARQVVRALAARVGRVVYNGWPTGVPVGWATTHGGPWPSSTSAASTAIGAGSVRRWLRPVTYQDAPEELLPEALTDRNPWHLPRRVNGRVLEP